MPRYIDANEFKREMEKYLPEDRELALKVLKSIKTADVVEVVRCRDCKWFDLTDPCGTLSPNAHRCKRVTRLWFEDDAFCAYGERRENEQIH